MEYQQAADKSFFEAEAARESEKGGKSGEAKEGGSRILLKLAQVLHK